MQIVRSQASFPESLVPPHPHTPIVFGCINGSAVAALLKAKGEAGSIKALGADRLVADRRRAVPEKTRRLARPQANWRNEVATRCTSLQTRRTVVAHTALTLRETSRCVAVGAVTVPTAVHGRTVLYDVASMMYSTWLRRADAIIYQSMCSG